MRKAKIICTMGPASRDEPTLGKLVAGGMDCARLNFSHGTHEDHARTIANVRRASEIAGRPIAVLLDLQGPKIRVGKIKGGKVKLVEDNEVTIVTDDVLGTEERFSCSYEGLPEDVTPGDPILVNDGAIRLEVISSGRREVRCRVVVGGVLSDNKGINLPGTPVSIPALTDKDLVDLQFGLAQGVDYVAMSFVRSADDIRQIKRHAPTTPIIAKLEKPQAVDRIDEIAQISDGVMIARGDLGVELPLERVPLIQKTGIERTNYHGKIAIVATQMLESMIVRPQARIVAFTAAPESHRRMALYWGVTSRRVPKPFESTDEMIATIAQTLVGSGDVMRGEAVIIASAVPPNRPTFGASMMQIHRL